MVEPTATNTSSIDADAVHTISAVDAPSSSLEQGRTCSQIYNEYAWPASVEQARIHQQATSLGTPSTTDIASCPCCENTIARTGFPWRSTNVSDALKKEYGVTVPLLFELMKYYAICILCIFCVNGIYAIHLYRRFCDTDESNCIRLLGFMPLMSDYDLINNRLNESERSQWEWVNFIAYLLIMVFQIFVDYFIERREKQENEMEIARDAKSKRSLLLSHVPDHFTQQDIIKYLTQAVPKIVVTEFFFILDISPFHEAFTARSKAFFQSFLPLSDVLKKSKSAADKQQSKMTAVKTQIVELSQRLHDSIDSISCKGKAIITLQTRGQCEALKHVLKQSSVRMLAENVSILLEDLNWKTRKVTLKSSGIRVSAPAATREIKWENMGFSSNDKIKQLVLAFVLSLIAAIVSGVLITAVSNKVSGIYVLAANLVIVGSYTAFLEYLAEKKKGKTITSKASFLMSKSGFFTLIYFVLLPVLYYGFASSQSTVNKVYSLFVLFLVNTTIQFITIAINPEKKGQRSFLKKLAKNPEIALTLPQKELNAKMQQPEFPIEPRMIGTMQLWSYATLHAFVCPYTLLVSIASIIVIYLITKKRLFEQFSLHSFKHLHLIRVFLWKYALGFQCAVLFMFIVSKNRLLFKILAAVFFVLSYAAYIIHYKMRNSKEKKEMLRSMMMTQSTAEQEQSQLNKDGDEQADSSLADPLIDESYDSHTIGATASDSYKNSFSKFLQKYENEDLEKRIETVLGQENPFQEDVLSKRFSKKCAPWTSSQ